MSTTRTRKTSRNLRFTRFRSTAFPKARGTVNPTRGPPAAALRRDAFSPVSLDAIRRSTRTQKAAK